MANNKVLFKIDVKKIRDIRNSLSISTTTTGRQILLGDTNQEELKKVVELLSQASNILEQIK